MWLDLCSSLYQKDSCCFSQHFFGLQALHNFYIHHPFIVHILLELRKLRSAVTFCWLPGHVGNERADPLAKTALSTPPIVSLCIPGSDYKPDIPVLFPICLQVDWTTYYVQHIFFSFFFFLCSPLVPLTNRHDDVVFMRLLLGHTLYTHVHLLQGTKGLLLCPHCNSPADLTVPHRLWHCDGLMDIRDSFFICTDLAVLFRHISAPYILAFLRAVIWFPLPLYTGRRKCCDCLLLLKPSSSPLGTLGWHIGLPLSLWYNIPFFLFSYSTPFAFYNFPYIFIFTSILWHFYTHLPEFYLTLRFSFTHL